MEDSGPGIPEGKRGNLFGKFQESLDLLNQGTGIGLHLCEKLTSLMGEAELWLDEEYHSGVEGCPGTRFILDLHAPPLDDGYWDDSHSLPDMAALETVTLMDTPFVEPDVFPMLQSQTEAAATQPDPVVFIDTSEGSLRSLVHTSEPLFSQHMETVAGENPAPFVDIKVAQHPRQQPPEHKELPKVLRVLFVDDDAILRKLFGRSVRRLAPEWKIEEASNGETALRMVESEEYDCIFLDQYMSSIDKQLLAQRLARALRAKGVSCRICGLSANDAAVADAGADRFLFKPFPCEKDALRRCLLGVLFARSERREKLLAPETLEQLLLRDQESAPKASIDVMA